MMIFDFFFYIVYRFLNKRLKRGEEDAKHSALSILVVYIPFSIDIIFYIIGLLHNNEISWIFIEYDFPTSVIIASISYIIFRIRYYRFYDIEDIEQKITLLSDIQCKTYKYLVRFILLAVPILGFVTYRLYKFGYV
jgi:hypothetical protein